MTKGYFNIRGSSTQFDGPGAWVYFTWRRLRGRWGK